MGLIGSEISKISSEKNKNSSTLFKIISEQKKFSSELFAPFSELIFHASKHPKNTD